jgi:hypothetical protein
VDFWSGTAISVPYFGTVSFIYRVSHIRCSTARHEKGCTACPRREQGKGTLKRSVAVKTR